MGDKVLLLMTGFLKLLWPLQDIRTDGLMLFQNYSDLSLQAIQTDGLVGFTVFASFGLWTEELRKVCSDIYLTSIEM